MIICNNLLFATHNEYWLQEKFYYGYLHITSEHKDIW